jgi:uncharacterized protein (TIGR03435 family)
MITGLANHLWQSTLFAGVAGLLTLAFQRNRANVRYGLWLAASCKFLIPFSLLIAVGSQWQTPPARRFPQLSFVMADVSQPFVPSAAAPRVPAKPSPPSRVPLILFCVWFSGSSASSFAWLRQYRRIRAIVRASSPLHLDIPVPAMSGPARLEPGVFGILRPVLLLPEGILNRLTPAQLQTIVAHELCHVRRRDNLAAAVHMLVEALFWFHPLVWWIGMRLTDERERACDESVVRATSDRQVYAEGILNVCKFYMESPMACVSGISGGTLKKRIQDIMHADAIQKLSLGKKLLLASTAVASVAAPILIGVMGAPLIHAQSRPEASLAFEAASVKPNKSPDFRGMAWHFLPGGRLTATNVPLRNLIAMAYNLPFQSMRLSGGPAWSGTERYDVEATAGPGAIPPGSTVKQRDDNTRLMLQNLLADRFKLVLRRETRELPAYVVVVAKNGLKLQKSSLEEKDCPEGPVQGSIPCHIINGGMGRGLHGKAVTVSDIVLFVENWSDRPMLDKTGIQGLFEVESDGWAPLRPRPLAPGAEPTTEDIAMADPTRPTIFLIFERLGLKMEAQKVPVETFVIDSVEKPTEN